MKRNNLVSIHLYCACFCSVILLTFAFSGSLHLLNFKESEAKTKIETFNDKNFLNSEFINSNITNYLMAKDKSYSFEYLKKSKNTVVTRPTTRDYYKFELNSNGDVAVTKVVPSLRKRLLEFHKGHGRKFSRIINAIFGGVLILTFISGLWLGLQNKKIRNATIVTTLISFIIFLVEFYS